MGRPRPDKIKLFLADVDGTLVTKDKILTERAQKAVRDLEAKGIKFALTSGRPPKGMKMLIEPLKITTPIAGFNGGLFVNADMSIIESRTLSPEAAHKTADLIAKQGLDVWLYSGDDWLIHDLNAPHREKEEHTVQFPPKVVKEYTDEQLKNAVKIVGVSDDLDKVAACEKAVREALGKSASAARSQPYYLDVTHPEANKGGVVAYLARTMKIDPGEIATIGDQPNDVLMFKPSGFSIAMGNASEAVQKEADVVTDSFDDEGFAKAVEKYLLA
ncbi:Cof-type HAD-IIB family hydrolase [Acidisphaera sp. L21]|jgi:Cof subfamily protein (haloacid dehalogenase superfamily)|uniref:Cof-type HAD-IIB family hydrolase n=1 Tax=Acidisphaera sp. L21 TaxID=1641851 RepID=UPI00131E0C41|nr:Cof-type HAD-IIB family hydrolase [Acidisphaera sp. L21]